MISANSHGMHLVHNVANQQSNLGAFWATIFNKQTLHFALQRLHGGNQALFFEEPSIEEPSSYYFGIGYRTPMSF